MKPPIMYSWISFYKEFANVLLEYKNNRSLLLDKLQRVYKNIDMPFPKLEADNSVIDIDPFTVFAHINKYITWDNKIKISDSIKAEFNIKSDAPQDFYGLPAVNNLSANFFAFKGKRNDNDIDNLWDFFECVLALDKDYSEKNKDLFIENYNKICKQSSVGKGITFGMFWVAPDTFISLDLKFDMLIRDTQEIYDKFLEVTPKFKNKTFTIPDGKGYLQLCDIIKEALKDGVYDCHTIYELSQYAYEYEPKEQWIGEDYNIDLTVEDWVDLLNDPEIFDEKSLTVVACFKEMGGMATCKQVAQKFGRHFNYYNIISTKLAKRIIKKCNLPTTSRENGDIRFWPVLYLGKDASKDEEGSFVWKLIENLSKALEQIDYSYLQLYDNSMLKNSNEKYDKQDFLNDVFMTEQSYNRLVALLKRKQNIILQGAPGVGKTYLAKRLVYSLIGAKDNSRVGFVQFHQNYSYEDFIMGYKPIGSSFELRYGIFYNFCKTAKENPDKDYYFIIDEINRGNMSKIFGELLMLIEADKRNENITMAYDNCEFSVPENLYIIGMMNTADRSLAMIDYALRRRFSFVNIEPGFESLGFANYQQSLNNENLNKVIDVIKELNIAIENDKSLGKGFSIGHSYFCNLNTCNDSILRNIIEYDIVPMLSEYWFDDNKKVDQWNKRLMDCLNENE